MANAVYMQLSKDIYKLPVAFADSPSKLSRITGVDARNISSQCAKSKANGKDTTFIKVDLDDER